TAAFLILGPEGIYQLGLHGFTSVPIAVALGGSFVIFNAPGFFYSLFATCLGILLWFLISPFFAPHGVPVLTSIFNVVTLLFLLPLKQPCIATKVSWLFAVDLDRVAQPEDTLRWYRLHKDAARYWKSIK
ncbi:MAG TPA: urea transporter, partial [Candidatus Avalokitesvara rifleensis]|uniref:urea transporter n=1 Tax=Candidatus Avalokitesvara rifleensis TaxID=3367620 RepID=UPI002712FBD3|nr:urea transporter [Candidatus Brocadiales bacterium]